MIVRLFLPKEIKELQALGKTLEAKGCLRKLPFWLLILAMPIAIVMGVILTELINLYVPHIYCSTRYGSNSTCLDESLIICIWSLILIYRLNISELYEITFIATRGVLAEGTILYYRKSKYPFVIARPICVIYKNFNEKSYEKIRNHIPWKSMLPRGDSKSGDKIQILYDEVEPKRFLWLSPYHKKLLKKRCLDAHKLNQFEVMGIW